MVTRVVIRGFGSIGQRHARVFSRLGCSVTVWPVRPRQVEHFATCSSFDDADLAVIATDTGRHVEDALEALASASHVLVEKPVSVDAASAQPLTEHADRVHVAAPLRGLHAYPTVLGYTSFMGALRSGRIVCQSALSDWRPNYQDSYSARGGEGGALRDLVHEIDYARNLFGDPAEVLGDLSHRYPHVADEAAADILWRGPKDLLLSLRLDFAAPVTRRSLLVDDGTSEVSWNLLTGEVTRRDAGDSLAECRPQPSADAAYETQAEALLAHLNGHEPGSAMPATLDDALAVMRICDAVRVSHQTRTWVSP